MRCSKKRFPKLRGKNYILKKEERIDGANGSSQFGTDGHISAGTNKHGVKKQFPEVGRGYFECRYLPDAAT